MLAAANEFRWSKAANSFASENGIARLESSLKQHLHNRYGNADYPCPLKVKRRISLYFRDPILIMFHKIRVFLDHLGNLDITSMPAAPSSLRNLFPLELSHLLPIDSQTWHIFVSPNSIAPSQYTTHKTTNRRIYDDVRAATCSAGAWGLFSEVLLVNTEHNVMEGSITTPYFYRRGRWVTPPAADGGNVGTTRRWALEKGLCVEESIAVNSLEPGERIWLSNGVRGWFWGHLETLGLREPSNLPDVTTAI